jgi:sulfoxide reductase heme-binding subunit YedZ
MSSLLAAAGPSALWYLARGAGAVTLLFLTVTVALGIVEVRRWRASGWPRFVVDQLHRNASLIALSLLAVHVLTTVLDGFAPIRLLNVFIPFTGHYRPFWLGLGALALDLVLALVLSSLMRKRLSRRAWRAVHWTAYACWPIALLHGLGTGTDPKAAWMLVLTGVSVAGVLIAVCFRVAGAVGAGPPARGVGYAALAAGSLALAVWVPSGPLAAGWARRAGAPAARGPPGLI